MIDCNNAPANSFFAVNLERRAVAIAAWVPDHWVLPHKNGVDILCRVWTGGGSSAGKCSLPQPTFAPHAAESKQQNPNAHTNEIEGMNPGAPKLKLCLAAPYSPAKYGKNNAVF